MKLFLLLVFLIFQSAYALEVDEKLTVRLLKTSESKKTVMINRGTEDGLVEGDHAKFIVTSGIVARGVCVKVSPSRSVWSVYRLVNADFIVTDSVMSIKITPPVKVTKDETQSLVQEDTPTKVTADDAAPLGIPLAEGAQDIGKVQSGDEDMKALEDQGPVIISEKNLEVFGMLNISGLSSNTKDDSGTNSFTHTQSYHHIGLGGELYAKREREWYSRFSLAGSVNLMRVSSQSYNGTGTLNDITEFEVGTNWHPTKLPSTTMQFIPFLHLGFGVGSAKSTYKSGSELGGQSVTASNNGMTQSFSVGFGYKYYIGNGLGMRAMADYYLRSESYKEDETTQIKWNKKVSGPRLMLGLSYRF